MNKREINRLIAEKVMGWKVVNKEYSVINKGKFPEEFKPSEYIEDAWEVLEKFDYYSLEKDAGHYYCTLHITNGKFFTGDGETAPLAICKASLQSVGIDMEGEVEDV